jgi:hypothetical protein
MEPHAEPIKPRGETPAEPRESAPTSPAPEQAPQLEQARETPREGAAIEQSGEPQAVLPPPVQALPLVTDEEHQRIVALAKKEQLDELTRIAFDEGVAKAVAIAKKLGNPYLLDEFHDSMIDSLRQHLIAEGKLEEL